MRKIYNFDYLFNNKRVAIVGNATSLSETKYGSDIDAHDLVIRMNRAPAVYEGIEMPESHGTKTDIWCMWRYREYEHATITKPRFMVQMAWWVDKPPENSVVYYIENPALKNELDPYWPSTGLMVLDWVSWFNPKVVSVYGFDWKKTPTITDQDRRVDDVLLACPNAHNFELEHKICQERYLHFNFIGANDGLELQTLQDLLQRVHRVRRP